MINIILSENHDVLGTLIANHNAIPGQLRSASCRNALLVNLSKSRFEIMFGDIESNHFIPSFDCVFFIKNNKNNHLDSVDALIADIKRLSLTPGTAIYIMTEDSLLLNINNNQLKQTFANLNNWLCNYEISVNFCIFGSYIKSHLLPLLNAQCTQIGTLSIASSLGSSQYSYKVIFSHSPKGVTTNDQYSFTPGTASFSPITDPQAQQPAAGTTHHADWNEVLTLNALLRSDETAPGHFQFFESIEQLAQAASAKSSATVIIPCSVHDDIEPISRLAYQLRKTAGNGLKLIIRELKPCIRYSDELFLLGSGINLVVPAELSFSRLLSQKNAIKNQNYSHQLPAEYEDLYRLRPVFYAKGLTDIKAFTRHVKLLVTNQIDLAVDFALIRLELLAGMDVQECLSLCRIHRAGDLVTPSQNAIYLFLSAVRANDITPALNRIFSMNIDTLFKKQTRYFNAVDIIEQLSYAQATAVTLSQDVLDSNEKQSPADVPAVHNPQSRPYAKRFPLRRQLQKVLT